MSAVPGSRPRRAAVTLALTVLAAGCAGQPERLPGTEAPLAGFPRPGPPGRLRVVSLNLLHGGPFSGWSGNDQDLEARLAMVVDELRALDPDVVGLQEASSGPRRGDVARRIARALGFHAVRGPVIGPLLAWVLRFSEGPAVLSRYPIVSWEAHHLPRCRSPWKPRVLVHAEVAAPGGPLPVFSTHTSGEPCQSRRVVELVTAARRGRPAVLVGDFNAVEGSPAIDLLTGEAGLVDAFRDANPGVPGPTVWQNVHAAAPTVRRRVDFVFVAPGEPAAATVVESRLAVNRPGPRPDGGVLWPTDHYGVVADLRIAPATARAE